MSRDRSKKIDVEVSRSPTRCPFCHDGVDPDAQDWRACRSCLARHHEACWKEGDRCGSCGSSQSLEPTADDSTRADATPRTTLVVIAIIALAAAIFGAAIGRHSVIARPAQAHPAPNVAPEAPPKAVVPERPVEVARTFGPECQSFLVGKHFFLTGAQGFSDSWRRGEGRAWALGWQGGPVQLGLDGKLRALDVDTGIENVLVDAGSAPTAAAIRADGRYAVLARGGNIEVWHLGEQKLQRSVSTGVTNPDHVALSPEGDRIVVASTVDSRLEVLETSTGRELGSFTGPEARVVSLGFVDGRVVTVGPDGSVRDWGTVPSIPTRHGHSRGPAGRSDGPPPAPGTVLRGPAAATAVASGPNNLVVAGDAWGGVDLWKLAQTPGEESRHVRHIGDRRTPPVSRVAVSPDGTLVATASWDGVRLWDLQSDANEPWDRIDLSSASNDGATFLAFSPDGRSLMVGTKRGLVLRFRIKDN